MVACCRVRRSPHKRVRRHGRHGWRVRAHGRRHHYIRVVFWRKLVRMLQSRCLRYFEHGATVEEYSRLFPRRITAQRAARSHGMYQQDFVCADFFQWPTHSSSSRAISLVVLSSRANERHMLRTVVATVYQERAVMLRIFFAVREYESPMILSADRGDGTILWESPQHLWESPQRFSSPDLDMSDPDQELLLDESTLCVSFSNCGRYFATVSNKAVRLWQSNTRKLLWTREPESLYY